MEIVNSIIIIMSVVGYIVVGRIQKSQFTKQNEIMNSYQEVLKIMNIDDIKKHVALKEENIELNFNNREIRLQNNEKTISDFLERTEIMTDEFELLKEEKKDIELFKADTKLLIEKSNNYIDYRVKIDGQLIKLYDDEFDELYSLIRNNLKSINESNSAFFETSVLTVRNEYLLKRTKLLKNRELLT